MLDSLIPQLEPNDEILVVADGPEAMRRCLPLRKEVTYTIHVDPHSVYGNAQRNYGMSLARCDLIWCCDDDDRALPGALTAIRHAMTDRVPTIFRMQHGNEVIWRSPVIEIGNVGGPQLIVPRDDKLPRYAVPSNVPGVSDTEWIKAVNQRSTVRWNEAIIYQCDEHGGGKP